MSWRTAVAGLALTVALLGAAVGVGVHGTQRVHPLYVALPASATTCYEGGASATLGCTTELALPSAAAVGVCIADRSVDCIFDVVLAEMTSL